jgi:hypothetical protein
MSLHQGSVALNFRSKGMAIRFLRGVRCTVRLAVRDGMVGRSGFLVYTVREVFRNLFSDDCEKIAVRVDQAMQTSTTAHRCVHRFVVDIAFHLVLFASRP